MSYECDKCKAIFITKETLISHKNKSHSEFNIKYSCFWNNCKFQTNDYKSYESHQSLHKNKIKLLDISGKSETINHKNDYSIASKTEKSKTTKISGYSTSGKYHLILKLRNN
jgi:hypothetical protein